MASIPHFYSDYQFSPEEFSEITYVMAAQENYGGVTSFAANNSNAAICTSGGGGGEQINVPMLYDYNGGIEGFRMETDNFSSRVPSVSVIPDQLGVSDMAVPCNSFMDCKFGFSNISKFQNFDGGFQSADACDFGDDCFGFMPNFKFVCPEFAADNWGFQCKQMPAIEHTNIKIGRYTVEERKNRILRYLKKRNQRNFNKTIKYACRKTLADRRVRVRGRFARNNELYENESGGKMNDNSLQDKESYCNDLLEMKNDDDDDWWLQEAVASLMYVPYKTG